MNRSKILNIYLIISGLVLTAVGGLTTFNPINIKANEGIDIAGNPSGLNDVRAFGMLLLALAIVLFLGIFKGGLKKTANVVAFLLFLSLGIGRVISMLIDGMPSDGMMKATGLEFILGIIGLILFTRNHNQNSI